MEPPAHRRGTLGGPPERTGEVLPVAGHRGAHSADGTAQHRAGGGGESRRIHRPKSFGLISELAAPAERLPFNTVCSGSAKVCLD